jgi:hypothetical protein
MKHRELLYPHLYARNETRLNKRSLARIRQWTEEAGSNYKVIDFVFWRCRDTNYHANISF